MFQIEDDMQNMPTDSEANRSILSSSPCSIAELMPENELYCDWSKNLHSSPMLENASSCLDADNASSLEEQVIKCPRMELQKAPTMNGQFCCAEKPALETSIEVAQKDNQMESIHGESIVLKVMIKVAHSTKTNLQMPLALVPFLSFIPAQDVSQASFSGAEDSTFLAF